jgi:hypothetical protein
MSEKPIRVVVTGSREWSDYEVVEEALALLPPGSRLAHGGARGLDTIAAEIALVQGFEVVGYPADWARHGKLAGTLRNRGMVDTEFPHLVLAFPLPGSIGTWHCALYAALRGHEVYVWGVDKTVSLLTQEGTR